MTNRLFHLVVSIVFFASPLCCPAAPAVRTVAELVTAVENGKDGDTIELAAAKFELERTLELKGGMVLKGAGIDKTTITHAASWQPATKALPDPEMRLDGLDTDAYLIRIRRDTQGVVISDMTLHGPAMHGAIFAWFHTGLNLHHLRIKDTLWCGVRTFGMKNAKIHDCEFINAGGRWENGKPGVKGGITGGGIFACWMADTEIWNNRFLDTRAAPNEHYYGVKVRQAKRCRIHHNTIEVNFSMEFPFENDEDVEMDHNICHGTISIPKHAGGPVPPSGRTFHIHHNYFRDSYSIEFVRNGVEIDHNLFDFDVQKDHGNLISAFSNVAAAGPASFHNNLVSNPGRGVMWMNEPYGKLEVRNNHIIARPTKTPRTDGLFGFNEKCGFKEFRFTDNIIECEGAPRPLFRNDASGSARVENNKLVNLADSSRYPNKATGKPQGLEQPLIFECGVNGELKVDGWKTRKALATAAPTQIAPTGPFAAEFFVAPTGDDLGDGSRGRPFASLERARDAVRSLKAKGGLPGPVAVRLLPGEYAVKATFELGADDSGTEAAPIVYRADRKGTVMLYGGRRLHGFVPVTDPAVLARIPETARGKVVGCDLRKLGVADLGKMVERGYGVPPPAATLELFFNGEAMRLARWPNEGFVNGVRVIEPGAKNPSKPSVFEYGDDRHARWAGVDDAWLFGYFRHGWADRQIRILKIDPATKQVWCGPYLMSGENMEPVKWFNHGLIKYYAFNMLEELDAPGEWYLDRRSNVLYLYPPSESAKATIEIGEWSGRVLSLRDVSDVRFEGLVLDLGRGDAVSIVNGRRCLFSGCTVKRFAGNGILVKGGEACGIVGCDIHSLGRLATEVIGGNRRTLTPGRHFVENCWMHHFGRLDNTYVPAVQLEGCGNRVAHNLIGDCPSSVVRIEGNDHLLEFNRVYRAILESEDQGAMELFGNPTYRGVEFRFNHFSDIGPVGSMKGSAGRAAIRLDDAISGLLIHGNIFHRASQSFGAININGGRDNRIENNLFAECEKGVTGQYNPQNKHWEQVGKNPAFILSELYLDRYPDLARLSEPPGLNHARRNVFWRCGPQFSTYGNPSEDKFELQHNTEAAADDPGLTAAAAAGFQFYPNSPVFARIGFQPIPVAGIGLYEDAHRASWPVSISTASTLTAPGPEGAP